MKLEELSARRLSALLLEGTISSVEILEAFQRRIQKVDSQVGSVVWPLWEEAFQQAERLDQERAEGNLRGPLHGLPLTIKDNIDVLGAPSTLGIQARKSHRAERDALVVRIARESGAIPMAKTNVPMALLSATESTNALYGTTRNPWSLEHGSGGSTGGESAALAAGCSVLGLGTDLGGSLRFPTGFCGVTGLKPTANRWSNQGLRSVLRGQNFMQPQLGPMARNVEDLIFLWQNLSIEAQSQADIQVAPVPLNSPGNVELSGMRIGYYHHDGLFQPAASCLRALDIALEGLEKAGAELVEFPLLDQDEAVALYIGAVSSDGMATLRGLAKGENIPASQKLLWQLGRIPAGARKLGARALPFLGQPRIAKMLETIGKKDVIAFWELNQRKKAFLQKEAETWNRLGIQALVCPNSVTPAVPLGEASDFTMTFGYTGRYNLLGLPAGTVPVSRVQPGETTRPASREGIEKRLSQIEARSLGLPLAVQVIGRGWQEHVVLAVMAAIESHARQAPEFPETPILPKAQASTL